MSIKIASCRHKLQTNFDKTRARSRRKCHNGLTASQDSTYKRTRRAIRSCNGVCDWDVARLAASCGISERQFSRDLAVLVALGFVLKIERRIAAQRNNTNLLMLPALPPSGLGDKNVTEKLELLETTTTTPAREKPRTAEVSPVCAPEPTPVRQNWEARRAQDRVDHHRMRERYEAVGRTLLEEKQRSREENRRWWREGERHRWHSGREHRLAMAQDRTRLAMRECAWVYSGPTMSEEEAVELRKRMEKNEMRAKFKGARARKRAEILGSLSAADKEILKLFMEISDVTFDMEDQTKSEEEFYMNALRSFVEYWADEVSDADVSDVDWLELLPQVVISEAWNKMRPELLNDLKSDHFFRPFVEA